MATFAHARDHRTACGAVDQVDRMNERIVQGFTHRAQGIAFKAKDTLCRRDIAGGRLCVCRFRIGLC